jgi:hypothetical protein
MDFIKLRKEILRAYVLRIIRKEQGGDWNCSKKINCVILQPAKNLLFFFSENIKK